MMRTKLIVAALAGLLGAVAVGAAGARTPNPPSKICINNRCVSPAPVGAQGKVKWNPGHYMASDGILYPGRDVGSFTNELKDLNWDNIIGYRVFTTWGALEKGQDEYDFSALDGILQYLKTHYDKPKHLVVAILPASFGTSLGSNDSRVIPMYIQTNSAYGPSPTPGRYGWWGPSSNGKSTSAYSAALWRPAVMNRFIKLMQAMGAHYNNDPYFEAIMFQEDSGPPGAAVASPKASDYSVSAMVTQYQAMLTAMTAAFPNTSIVFENTWGVNSTSATQQLEVWMVQHRIAPGSADVLGQTAFDYKDNHVYLNFGMAAYLGIGTTGTPYDGGDLRDQSRAMLDIEASDMAGTYFARWGGPYSTADLLAALNQTYKASHAFWTHLVGTESVPGGGTVNGSNPEAVWSKVAPYINSHPLTNTGYPPNYP